MKNPCFFGYGSLVNRATHRYPNAQKARANGWKRAWVHTAERPFAFLTAIRAPGEQIEGLTAEVPNADWIALDEREHAYDRITDSDNIEHGHPPQTEVAIYAVPAKAHADVTDRHPILLSYLDVVVQGYLQEFGRDGAERFLRSTDGWDAPILNDRVAPIYPRHQLLTSFEKDVVDAALRSLGSTLIERD